MPSFDVPGGPSSGTTTAAQGATATATDGTTATTTPAQPDYVPAGYTETSTGVLVPKPQAMTAARLHAGVATAIGQGYSAPQITAHLAQDTGPIGDQVRTALKWYSPEEIIDHLNATNPSGGLGNLTNAPVIGPVLRGGAQAFAGMANLMDDVGLHRGAANLRSNIDQEDLNAKTSASNVVDGIKSGHYGAALAAVPSAILEGAVPAGAAIAGGIAAGPMGAALAAGGVGALTQGDSFARARAINNGRQSPDATDLTLGLTGAAGVGALGSVGLPGAVGNAAGTGLKGALMATAAHGAAGAAQPQAAALAGSVGTQAGPTLADGADSAAAALEGLTGRAVAAAPGVMVSYSPSARSQALATRYAALSPDAQQQVHNVVAAHQALNDAAASTIGTAGAVNTKTAAATASNSIHRNVAQLVGTLGQQGIIDGGDGQVIGQAMAAARSPSRLLTQDHLDAIDGLGLAPADATSLKNAAVQMNLLSDPDGLRTSAGPFQGVMHVLGGHWGGALAGGLIGGSAGATAGYVAGSIARPVLRGALGSLGASLDGTFGLGQSPLARAASSNRAMLTAAGVGVPDAAGDLQSATLRTRDAIAQQRALIPGALPPVMQAAANRAALAGGSQGSPGLDTAPPDGFTAPSAPTGPASATGASVSPAAASPGTYAPDVSGLSPAALAQAQRLPAWIFGLGNDLQNALHVSGQARPVNMAAEVGAALDSLTSKGWLPQDLADGLRGHSGRVVPVIYQLLRSEMLLHNGIDRTASGNGLAAGGASLAGS